MLANARYLNESLEAIGEVRDPQPRLAEPVVTFKLKGDPGFDVYHLSARLRENGWIVPAYSLPPDAEHVHLMRVVVRLDLSRDKIDMLMMNMAEACEYLDKARPAPHAAEGQGPPQAAGALLSRRDGATVVSGS